MVGKRRTVCTTTTTTRSNNSAPIFGGQPSPLDKTEPPTLRQVIQYSYFLQDSYPDMKHYDIAKMIAKDVTGIWQAVNPRLPLFDDYYVLKMVDRACFKKAKQINRKCLSTVKEKNLVEKLDKLFDLSACTCKLPVVSCDDRDVECNEEHCQTRHIICTCLPRKKVPVEERQYLKDQRAKIGPKGTFQLGPVDKAAVKKCQRSAAERERLDRQIEKQQQVDSATFTSTSQVQDTFFSQSSGSEKTGDNISS